jgi:hypothetical protein
MTKNELKKAKLAAKRSKIVAHYEGSISGTEPMFDDTQKSWSESQRKTAMLNALNYYNARYERSQCRKVLTKHFAKSKAPVPGLDLSLLTDSEIPQTLAGLVAMQDRGWIFSPSDAIYYANATSMLRSLCLVRSQAQVAKELVSAAPTKTIMARVDEQTSKFFGAIEEKIDQFIIDGCTKPFSLKDWLAEQSVKAVYAKKIASFFTRNRDEIVVALKKSDPYVTESYANFTTAQLKALHAVYENIVADAESWTDAKVSERKAPTRKPKPASSLVKRLQYQTAFAELKLTSVNPEKIIGAGHVWTYDTKTRRLTWLQAKDADGLSVKGTTILNFDPALSGTKTLRKPALTIPAILGTQRSAEKAFTSLKVKAAAANGRVNGRMILVKVCGA